MGYSANFSLTSNKTEVDLFHITFLARCGHSDTEVHEISYAQRSLAKTKILKPGACAYACVVQHLALFRVYV